jgi:hypothetical protein
MPRPTNKSKLLIESQKEYDALEQLLATLTPEQMTQPGALGDWSVKDVLAHLYEWQQMFFRWYTAGLKGEQTAIPAEGYKWSQLPALNQKIYETYHQQPLNKIQKLFKVSHRKTMALIESLSEEDLFTPARYPWMNQTALVAYINANTGSHYRWARKEMRKNLHAKG